ncbi:hypothetical protein SYNPS1DRAFT_14409 [Syncephalis pseudoplumigaleata]|uniref:U1-type domain-containing protein n=1 Tax=Syncephalis pseudoplumigaleata TaxID=1712513 RepID=A0A4P9Z401_9FUNG|nr:hypothetical protein SYNPS1DRAFT_14409 [Syncephalis pseudoplumigaleata]|eukprot:RKP26270.1 hypothetical protein SYNPS1DRAFT_14409 [Syncephalis pseudoplumigaleata]
MSSSNFYGQTTSVSLRASACLYCLLSGYVQDTSTRKKWDIDEYRKRAAEREIRERQQIKDDERRKLGLPPKKVRDPAEEEAPKELLKQREGKLNLDARVGKTQIAVSTATTATDETGAPVAKPSGQRQPGFYCETCDCTLKDSISYLDHINGRKHQINMGQIMTVERSTLEQVRARLALLKRKKSQVKKAYGRLLVAMAAHRLMHAADRFG